jgi:hypothetical protein
MADFDKAFASSLKKIRDGAKVTQTALANTVASGAGAGGASWIRDNPGLLGTLGEISRSGYPNMPAACERRSPRQS